MAIASLGKFPIVLLKLLIQIELLDFGATRSFDKHFLDLYLRVLQAAAKEDREAVSYWSTELGFLTGYETEASIICGLERSWLFCLTKLLLSFQLADATSPYRLCHGPR